MKVNEDGRTGTKFIFEDHNNQEHSYTVFNDGTSEEG